MGARKPAPVFAFCPPPDYPTVELGRSSVRVPVHAIVIDGQRRSLMLPSCLRTFKRWRRDMDLGVVPIVGRDHAGKSLWTHRATAILEKVGSGWWLRFSIRRKRR